VDKIKALLDELAAVVAEMEAMSEAPAEGDAPAMDAEEESSLRSLSERADKLRSQIELLRAIEAKNLELRAVLERGAPAKAIEKAAAEETPVEKRTVPAIPVSHGPLKAFRSAESAYRAGMHIKGFIFGDAEARRWCNDHNVESRAQAGGVNSLGGVLTSPELSNEIIRLVEEYGVFPQYARRVPMSSDTLNIARRTGGLAARPVGENAEVLASDVTFDNVELVAKIWGVANRVPNSLLEDSVIDLADLMAVETAQAFAEAVDNSAFGPADGESTYHGVVSITKKIVKAAHSASVVSTTAGTEDTYGELTMKNFTDMVAKLPTYARRNARFYISPSGWGSRCSPVVRAALAATRPATWPPGSVRGSSDTRSCSSRRCTPRSTIRAARWPASSATSRRPPSTASVGRSRSARRPSGTSSTTRPSRSPRPATRSSCMTWARPRRLARSWLSSSADPTD
jgi:HK97 family phage major capsid protein